MQSTLRNLEGSQQLKPKMRVLLERSERILSPRLSSSTGFSIHLRREGGTQAGAKGRLRWCSLARLQNCEKEALDRWSAKVAKVVEHLVILLRSTEQPKPVATFEIAITKVVDKAQELLYPFFQM